MDSRRYVFIFPIASLADVPAEFKEALKDTCFERAVFLPQADPGWFTRVPAYPARILLVSGDQLHILPHPSSSEQPVRIDLSRLIQIEHGTHLLFGWVRFDSETDSALLHYNTRASDPLDKFLASLAERCFSKHSIEAHPNLSDPPDVKFRSLLQSSLAPGEVPVFLSFLPPKQIQSAQRWFRRTSFQPGHLLAATSHGRLLWIRDEYRGRYERFSATIVTSSLDRLQSATGNANELILTLSGHRQWRLPSDHAAASPSQAMKLLSIAAGK